MMKTAYQHMMDQELYDVNDEKLVRDRLAARNICDKMNDLLPTEVGKLTELSKQLFGSTGEYITVMPHFRCDYGYNIHVGENFFVNYDCIFFDTCPIKIGKNALIAPRVQIYAAGHPLDVDIRTSWLGYGKPVTIGDNCWIGGNATIVPGVTLGDNVIVGAGSVVTKSFGDNLVIAGNPAKIIRHLK